MSFGSSSFGSSPYGGSSASFGVVQAVALNAFTVQVTFEADIVADPATLNPANYQIPGVTIVKVVLDPQPDRIRLITSLLDYITYELTVSTQVRSAYGVAVSSLSNTTTFSGWPKNAGFTARAVSNRAIQVLFSQSMLMSPDISTTTNYVVTDLSGAPVAVLSAVPNSESNLIRVRLNLAAALVPGKPYAVHVSDVIVTSDSRTLTPNNANVVWYQPRSKVAIPLSRFTGEVRAPSQTRCEVAEALVLQEAVSVLVDPNRSFSNVDPNFASSYAWSFSELVGVTKVDGLTGAQEHNISPEEKLALSERLDADRSRSCLVGETLTLREQVQVAPEPRSGLDDSTTALFGSPNGQVFFSPSLVPGALGQSSISVDDVQVCTRAYDVYRPPPELDPAPLYTHGGGLVPTPTTTLSGSFVLFAKFDRLTGAKTNLAFKPTDALPRPVDVGASITLTQVYDPARFSLLNNTAWHLFDNSGLAFVVADNLSPVGAPVVSTVTYFASPAEDYLVVESLDASTALAVGLSETLTMTEGVTPTP